MGRVGLCYVYGLVRSVRGPFHVDGPRPTLSRQLLLLHVVAGKEGLFFPDPRSYPRLVPSRGVVGES